MGERLGLVDCGCRLHAASHTAATQRMQAWHANAPPTRSQRQQWQRTHGHAASDTQTARRTADGNGFGGKLNRNCLPVPRRSPPTPDGRARAGSPNDKRIQQHSTFDQRRMSALPTDADGEEAAE